jgi:hypothetical protein
MMGPSIFLSVDDDLLSLVIEQLLPTDSNDRTLGPVVSLSTSSAGDQYARIDAFLRRLVHLRRCKKVCKRLRALVAGADLWRDLCERQWPWMQRRDEATFCATLRRCMQPWFARRGPGPEGCRLVACVRQGYRCVAHGALALEDEDPTRPRPEQDVLIGHTTSPANPSTIEFRRDRHSDGWIMLDERVVLRPLLDDKVVPLVCEVYSVDVDGTTRLISGGELDIWHPTLYTQCRDGGVRWHAACGHFRLDSQKDCNWSMAVDFDVTMGEGRCVGTPSRIGLHVREHYRTIGLTSLPYQSGESWREFWLKCEALVQAQAREIAVAVAS